MYLLSRLSIYLYVFMFYPVIVNMYLNRNARCNTLYFVISLNTIILTLFTYLSKTLTFVGLVLPSVVLIITITVIFVVSGILLVLKTPKRIQEYDELIEKAVNKGNCSVREVLLIESKIKNWTIVSNMILASFIFSLIYHLYSIFILKTKGIDLALVTWLLSLLGASYFLWKFSENSMRKLIKKPNN